MEVDRPDVQTARRGFWRKRALRNAAWPIFLDETGVHLSMTRSHARAPRGERAVDAVPKNWGDSLTVVAGLSLQGIVAPMMLDGAMNARAFEAYVEQALVPVLRKGDLVIMDNLAAHKRPIIAELIQAKGAELLYLPPYSPDFNPIEPSWSKFKAVLRKLKARSTQALYAGVAFALRTITPSDSKGWFRHCGHYVP